MSEFLEVVCPEHEQREIVEVAPATGEIKWCSKVAGRPSCGGLCLSQGLRPEAVAVDAQAVQGPPSDGPK